MARNGYGHMVLDYYVARMRDMRTERAERMAKLTTKEEALAYRDKVRSIVAQAFVKPAEKVPLEAVVTGSVDCDGYTLEKVRFCSRPNFWVTGNVYLPKGVAWPAPAVLAVDGHATVGKASSTYQEFCIRLVRNGFVVLHYDPIQQGERDQYVKLTDRGMGTGLCGAHNEMGKQLGLLDDSFGSWRVWDGRVALDYLLTRPEVDPKHVGITGNSGGGTLTEWIFANEDRLTMAAPSCHVTSFLTNLENELPTDAEQCPTGVIGGGLEMVDLLIAQAPKPVILLGQKYDFFERRGLQWAYQELKRFYALLGAEDKVNLFIGPRTHGYSMENQEAMTEFFCQTVGKGASVKLTPKPLGEAETYATSEGNVVKAGSRPIYELLSAEADKLAASRTVPADTAAWKAMLTSLLQLPKAPAEAPHFRIPRAYRIDGKVWARYAVETEEPGIRAILKKRLTNSGYAQTLDVEEDIHLYLPHICSEEEVATIDWVKGLNPEGELYALDVRGLGESMPEEEYGTFIQPYGMDFMFHSFGEMFGESYFGRRVFDLLRTLDLLAAEGAKTIHLYGNGQGALLAMYGAMLHDSVVSVELHDAPESYRSWIDSAVSPWPSACALRGVLKHFDLPDLKAALVKKGVIVK